MSSQKFTAIILAGGRGQRMASEFHKSLHLIAGETMLSRIIKAFQKAKAQEVRVVVSKQDCLVTEVAQSLGASVFRQETPLGTADAVLAAKINELSGLVFICNGDHPLVSAESITKTIDIFCNEKSSLSVLSAHVDEPQAFGRIIEKNGELQSIIEAKFASPKVLKIKKVNTGAYIFLADTLKAYLPCVMQNAQEGEYNFTDIVSVCRKEHQKISTIEVDKNFSQGVNDQMTLARVSKEVYLQKANSLMQEGVTIIDPDNTYIEESVQVASGTIIYPGVFLKGKTQIGEFCVLEPNVFIKDCEIKNNVQIKAGSYLEESKVAQKSVIGPYAHLRPESEVGEDCRIGNFVELKKTKMGDRSKAAHLTYLGDATVGSDSNIGCGVITVNYSFDKKKYNTKIGKNSFIGSGVQLVAPLSVGKDTFIACGAVITKEVPDGSLAINRSQQIIKENYKPKSKKDS